jgi:hypothetical protein
VNSADIKIPFPNKLLFFNLKMLKNLVADNELFVKNNGDIDKYLATFKPL